MLEYEKFKHMFQDYSVLFNQHHENNHRDDYYATFKLYYAANI